ncbi:WD40 repeat domain-containing protein [Reticulibacter mediterranei]|uniref:WD40 repeat domain-containing protein n=1 Tax=Reticulibacter mediterranei TaxID=2778369 RepID=UPI00357121E5
MYSAVFSPEDRILASGSENQTVRLWQVDPQKCIHMLHDHSDRIRSVTFGPDGNTLISGSHDDTIKI